MLFHTSRKQNVTLDEGNLIEQDELDDEEMSAGWFKSLTSSLIISPSDLYMDLNESIELIDWDDKSKTIAKSLGNSLTFLFFTIRLLQDNLIKPNYHKIYYQSDSFDLSKSDTLKKYDYLIQFSDENVKKSLSANDWYFYILGFLDKAFTITIIILSILNIYCTYQFLWGYFKTYSIFYLTQRPDSINITTRSIKDLNAEYFENAANGSLWSRIKYILHERKEENDTIDSKEEEDSIYYQLDKWVPSKFITSLFCTFSPTCILFLFCSEVSFSTAIAVILHQYIFHYIIMNKYKYRIIDETILASATLVEVDAKYSKPRLSKKVQDVQIDATSSGKDFIARFYPAVTSVKTHTFQTHSMTGETITETYNTKTKQFENENIGNEESHNIIRIPPPGGVTLNESLYFAQQKKKNGGGSLSLSPTHLRSEESYGNELRRHSMSPTQKKINGY